uniref:Uncharacterized protein n=1 Tax=Globodera rostochiensis TaxID=31243 RepID=A0A914HS28_GLORO
MEEFWLIILVAFFATNSLDKAESVKVKLEETPLKSFDEIFGDGWWDKDETEYLKTPPTNFGQNVHHQIDRQNTQIGQIEPNATDQLGQFNPIQLISLDKLNPIQLISLDKLNPIQLISLDKLNTIQKREFGQTKPQHKYSHNQQKKLMKRYYQIKDQNPKMSVGDIAKRLKIGRDTLCNWKKASHFVKENAAANVQEIDNSNLGSI